MFVGISLNPNLTLNHNPNLILNLNIKRVVSRGSDTLVALVRRLGEGTTKYTKSTNGVSGSLTCCHVPGIAGNH